MTERRCEWCGDQLDPGMRADAKACGSSCRAAITRYRQGKATEGDYALRSDQAPALPPNNRERERWATAIRTVAVEVLIDKGELHADDIRERLDVPEHFANLIGREFGGMVQRRSIHEVGRRRSKARSRHGAKSGVYEPTEEGRKKLAVIAAQRRTPEHAGLSSSGDQGDATPAGETDQLLVRPAGEPAQLFGAPGAGSRRPLNPLTDADAA